MWVLCTCMLIRMHACACVRVCVRSYAFQLTHVGNWVYLSVFNQTKVEKGAPREHFSLQMKSDENRPIITSESSQSTTFSRKNTGWVCVCVCVCVCLIHLSTKLWVKSKKPSNTLYKCHVSSRSRCLHGYALKTSMPQKPVGFSGKKDKGGPFLQNPSIHTQAFRFRLFNFLLLPRTQMSHQVQLMDERSATGSQAIWHMTFTTNSGNYLAQL